MALRWKLVAAFALAVQFQAAPAFSEGLCRSARAVNSTVRWRSGPCHDGEVPIATGESSLVPLWYDQAGRRLGAYQGNGDLLYRHTDGRFYLLTVDRLSGAFARGEFQTDSYYQSTDCSGMPYLPSGVGDEASPTPRGFFLGSGSVFYVASVDAPIDVEVNSFYDLSTGWGCTPMHFVASLSQPRAVDMGQVQEPLVVK